MSRGKPNAATLRRFSLVTSQRGGAFVPLIIAKTVGEQQTPYARNYGTIGYLEHQRVGIEHKAHWYILRTLTSTGVRVQTAQAVIPSTVGVFYYLFTVSGDPWHKRQEANHAIYFLTVKA